jgi:hypothetical protein
VPDVVHFPPPAGTEQYAPGAAAAVVALCVWPVVWPLIQIGRLADMDGEKIEDALELKEPIQVGRPSGSGV